MTYYKGPIVDAHHHFWQPSRNKQPWLMPGVDIGFRYGPYESIKKDYLPPDLLHDAEGFNLVGTVTMETEWRVDDPVGEMLYMQKMKSAYGLPDGSAAHAVLVDKNVEATLEKLADLPIVKSVRNKPGQSANYRQAKSADTLFNDSQWQKGFKLLRKYSLPFELQVGWWHLDDAGELFNANPDIPIIINHCALPSDRSLEAISLWKKAVQKIAGLPQVVMKISGIGLQGVPWTANNNREIVETLAECFGADRIMFASNFPVDSLCGSYKDIFGGFVEITKNWSLSEQRAAFIENAVRIYELDREILNRKSAPNTAFEIKDF